ncbi:MAG: arylsulfatase [Planctomycetota bacterium]|jgi:arylsulfatase B
MHLQRFLIVLLAVMASPVLATSITAAEAQPNVVIVITDDQGYGDLSCHGNPVLNTPNLDALHAESVRLTDYHVSPTCSPTRAALLTGHWTNRTGVWHTIMGRSMIRENEMVVAEMFRRGGYATGMFGKWHLGDNYPCRPEDRGFTEVMRHGGGGVGQTPDFWDNAYFDGSYWHNSVPEAVDGYCTDVWFDYAKQFITQQKKDGKPFLAYIATNAPHGPNHAPEKSAEPYDELGTGLAHFFGMISNIDDNVGKMRKFLAKEGLAENTIFIFTTDNGTAGGANVFNSGMRGRKGSEYEGGHRVPFFIHWPKGGLTGGRDVTDLTAHVDVVPTLLDLCNVSKPNGVRFDGTSIRPLLEGKVSLEAGSWPDRILITDSQRVKDPIKWRKSAVMTSRWRLNNQTELYDIKADPGQKKNVASDHPDVVTRLTDFYDAWWEELTPTFKQDVAIALGHKAENPARLTCHDWITTGSTPWNQSHVRNAVTGPRNTGFWNVNVAHDGEYTIELRRWPREIDAPINASLDPGAEVPGVKAYRARPGKPISVTKAEVEIAGQKLDFSGINDKMQSVEFRLKLKAGRTRLSGRFLTDDGTIFGAYYAYVKRQN